MAQQNAKARLKTLNGFEDCRVVEIGIEGFAECAQWGPVDCPHALPFGYCFLCMHPHVDDLIENTKKVLQAAKR